MRPVNWFHLLSAWSMIGGKLADFLVTRYALELAPHAEANPAVTLNGLYAAHGDLYLAAIAVVAVAGVVVVTEVGAWSLRSGGDIEARHLFVVYAIGYAAPAAIWWAATFWNIHQLHRYVGLV